VQLHQVLIDVTPLHRTALRAGTSGGASRLLGAYYVFAFGQLEAYIKTIVEDILGAISGSTPAFDKWPDLLLGYFLHKGEDLGNAYRKFGHNEDEGAILEFVARSARKVVEWESGGTMPGLQPAAFLDKKKYPSARNLPQLFKRLGVKRIWANINAAGKMNGEWILTSLNDLRTNIAHEGKVPIGFGLVDFRNSLGQMRRFVVALDRGVSREFCGPVMSRKTWNIAMS